MHIWREAFEEDRQGILTYYKTMVFRKRESAGASRPVQRTVTSMASLAHESELWGCLSPFLWKRPFYRFESIAANRALQQARKEAAVEIPLFPPNEDKAAAFPSRR